jgi:carbon storage regulator
LQILSERFDRPGRVFIQDRAAHGARPEGAAPSRVNRIGGEGRRPEPPFAGRAAILVLTRKKNEQIVIRLGGEQVVVTLIDAHSGKARIGVMAPRHVAVHRREIFEAIERGKEATP